MASELRHETLFDTGGDGVVAVSAGAEFRNDSSQIIHIRGLSWNHNLASAAINEGGAVELSKSPVIATNTNNNVFFTEPQEIRMDNGDGVTATQTAGDSGKAENGREKYGRGQLTLEPNESLFVNIAKSSGGIINARYNIRYHF